MIIPGATNDQLTVTQAGTYELEVTYGGCNVIDDILVEYITNPVPGTPNPLIVCDEVPNDGEAVFTLTDADADIINGQTGVFVTYYLNQIEADQAGVIEAFLVEDGEPVEFDQPLIRIV